MITYLPGFHYLDVPVCSEFPPENSVEDYVLLFARTCLATPVKFATRAKELLYRQASKICGCEHFQYHQKIGRLRKIHRWVKVLDEDFFEG